MKTHISLIILLILALPLLTEAGILNLNSGEPGESETKGASIPEININGNGEIRGFDLELPNMSRNIPGTVIHASQPQSETVYFPDANFKAALLENTEINTNGDAEIQIAEAAAFTGMIHVAGEGISDLTGIEAFTALTDLRAHYNVLETVDLSANTQLRELHLQNNQLSRLDLSANGQISKLRLMNNNLLSLDLSFQSGLRHLELNNNSLTALNIKNGNNHRVYKLVTLGNTNLECITVDDVAHAEANLTDDIEPGTTFSLSCGAGEGEDPDIESFQPTITASSSTDLPLPASTPDKSLELIGDPEFNTYKWIRNNTLIQSSSNNTLALNDESGELFNPATDVGDYTLIVTDAEGNESLVSEPITVTYTEPEEPQDGVVYIPDANFKAALLANTEINTNNDNNIQVTEAASYTGKIHVAGEDITDLTGIEAFTALTDLRAHYNGLTQVDLSHNLQLRELHLQYNNLNSLNLSANRQLNKIRLMNNNLASLDLSLQNELRYLEVNNNTLTSLNVRNGNNHRMSKLVTLGNSALECITVDDVAYAESTYSENVEPGTSFSTNCSGGEEEDPDIESFQPTITASSSTDLPLPASTPDKSLELIGDPEFNTYKWIRNNTLIQSSSNNTLALNDESGELFNPATDVGDYTLIVADAEGNESLVSEPITVTYTEPEEPQDGVVYIPDANFKAALLANTEINTNSDNNIQVTEAASYTGKIHIAGEDITDLTGIEAFTALTDLRAHYNELTQVDLSHNLQLRELHLQYNNLTSLNLSANRQLNKIRLMNNNLASLDLSLQNELRYLEVNNNTLTSLNVRNGNNHRMSKLVTLGNSALECITVDDVAYAESTYSENVEPGTSFSTNCSGGEEEDPDIISFKPTIAASSSTDLPLPESTADKSLELIGDTGYTSYLWYRNDTLVQNNSSNVLVLNNASGDLFDPSTDVGDYTLIVADGDGNQSIVSDPIAVTYTDPEDEEPGENDDVFPTGPGEHVAEGTSIRQKEHDHYYKMVTWDDSEYIEFAYWIRHDGGYITDFMNFRVKFPEGFDKDENTKYPTILMLHGAGESGRKWTGHYEYEPSDPEYDNNGHNLLHGGSQHLQAVNRDPSNSRAYPGIVIFPQASYNGAWGDANLEMVFAFLEYMIEEYDIDQNKITVHGLSNGAKGTWKAIFDRPDLFCAALPMSGVGRNRHDESDIALTLPIWLFQGELDINPTPGAAEGWIEILREKGGTPRYTMYEDRGHNIWNSAYNEPDFFSWIREQDKRNIHVLGGKPNGCADPAEPLELGISDGFQSYQWTRNGQDISGATGRFLTASTEGTYTVKFMRQTDNSWVESFPINICYSTQSVVARMGESEPLIIASGATSLPVPDEVTTDKSLHLLAPSGYVRYKWYKDGELFSITKDSILTLNDSSGSLFSDYDSGAYSVKLWDHKGMMKASDVINVTYDASSRIEADLIVHIDSGLTIRDKEKSHYHPMMTWDESSYTEFAYWEETDLGSIINFLNFRVLFPEGYDKGDTLTQYPAIVMLHGAGESGRKFDKENYVIYEYQPGDPEYDNNSHQLLHAGIEHRDAVMRDGETNSFPGIIIMPQVSYNGAWSDEYTEDFGTVMEYMIKEYHVNPDKIAIHGLSNGARGVWKLTTQRPDIFAAALPMSGVGTDMERMTDVNSTTPYWIFQGELDTNPSPGYSYQWYEALEDNGGTPKYTLYEEAGHEIWNIAYREPDFFSWIMAQDKKKIHVMGGQPVKSCENTGETPLELGISAGYLEYQWIVDGQEISGANSRFITANKNGSYKVRFKRRTDGTWAESYPLEIFYSDPNTPNLVPSLMASSSTTLPLPEIVDRTLNLYAVSGFAKYEWYKDGKLIKTSVDSVLQLNDEAGERFMPADAGKYTVIALDKNNCATKISEAVTITYDSSSLDLEPPVVHKTVLSSSEIQVDWTDTNYESAYELWGARKHTFRQDTSGISGYPGSKYQFITILSQNLTSYVVQGLRPAAEYNYMVRALDDNTGVFSEETADYVITGEDVTPPMKPTELVVENVYTNEIELSWESSVDDDVVYQYEIYDGTNKLADVKADTLDNDPTDGNPNPSTTFILDGLQEGTTYIIGIKAVDYQGNNFAGNASKLSNTVEITTGGDSGENENASEGEPLIFPNPFKDQITIRLQEQSDQPITLFDYTGRLIQRTERTSKNEIIMDLNNLRKGLYILNIGDKNYKLIKNE